MKIGTNRKLSSCKTCNLKNHIKGTKFSMEKSLLDWQTDKSLFTEAIPEKGFKKQIKIKDHGCKSGLEINK